MNSFKPPVASNTNCGHTNYVDNELEKKVEERLNRGAKANGWLSYKFTAPGRRAVPDRLYMKGRVIFVEIKRCGEEASKAQAREHKKMRAAGAEVYVVAGLSEADNFIKEVFEND